MALATPVTIAPLVPRELVVATGEHLALGSRDIFVQGRQRDQWLDRRARRVLPTQGTIEQRPALVIAHGGEIGLRDSVDKGLGIKTGGADQRQHLAVIRIDGHDRAIPPGQRPVGRLLQVHIQGQGQVRARLRRGHRQLADHPPLGVHLHLAIARPAVQQLLVVAFDPALADMRGPGIGPPVHPAQILLVDAPDITDRVREFGTQGIETQRTGLDLDPRQFVARDRNTGHGLVIQPGLQQHRLKRAPLPHPAVKALDIGLAQFQVTTQAGQEGIQVIGLLDRDLQLVGRSVARQQDAIAVANHAPGGGDRLDPEPVVLGEGSKMRVRPDLQPREPPAQRQQNGGQDHQRQQDTHDETLTILLFLAVGVAFGHLSGSRRRDQGRGPRTQTPHRPGGTARR